MVKPLSAEVERSLYDLYYNRKYMFGRDKLYKFAVSEGIKVSRRGVMEWLREQQVHQLFHPTNKTKDITRTVLNKPHKQIAIDLIDMSNKEFKKMKYILTAIDLFSKKAYAKAIPDKTGKVVANAMQSIIKTQIHQISSIRSDKGSEFISAEFKKMLEKHNIKQVLSLPSKPQSNGGIERFNKTLQQLLSKAMKVDQSEDWPKYLPKVVDVYNNVQHSITKQVPNELDKGSAETVKEAHTKIKQNATNKRQSTKVVLKVGDKVRIKLDSDDPVKFNSGESWSRKLYKISKIMKPKSILSSPSFRIADGKNLVPKVFYVNDLLYVPRVRNIINEPQKYEILRLVRPLYHDGKPAYEVKWKGYSSAENTIEPRTNLLRQVPKVIRTYERNNNVKFHKNSTVTWDK